MASLSGTSSVLDPLFCQVFDSLCRAAAAKVQDFNAQGLANTLRAMATEPVSRAPIVLVYDPDAVDCNTTARLDSCEIADGIVPDCNENGRPDSCDIADGISEDKNGDGIPDECCLADIPCDGVNGLIAIIGNLGCVGTPPTCPGDFNCSGLVDTEDILDYLSQCSFK